MLGCLGVSRSSSPRRFWLLLSSSRGASVSGGDRKVFSDAGGIDENALAVD